MKNRSSQLVKNTMIYGIGQIVRNIIGFFFLPLFTSYLTPIDYGVFAILTIISMIFQAVLSLGIGVSIGICYFDKESLYAKEETIWSSFAILCVSATVIMLFALFASGWIGEIAFDSQKYNDLIALSLLGLSAYILSIPLSSYLQFEEKATTYVASTIGAVLATLALNILLIVEYKLGVQGLVISSAVVNVAVLIAFLVIVGKNLKFRVSGSIASKLIGLGIPLVPSFAFLFLMQQADKYILQKFTNLHDVGVYSIGANLGMVMSVAVSAFTTAWFPYFMSFVDKKDDAIRTFSNIFTYYVIGFGFLCICFYTLAKPVVMIMTHVNFHDAYKVVGLSATAQFLSGVFALLLPGIYFAKEVKYVSVIQGASAVLTIALYYILIPLKGIWGAAISFVLGNFIMAAMLYLWNIYRKYMLIEYEWKRVRKIFYIIIIYAAVMLWPRGCNKMEEIAISSAGMILLPIFCYALLNKEERYSVLSCIKSAKHYVFSKT